MRISIIIPVYNAAKYINIPISSLKQQTFSDYEVILINDGSTDKTKEVIENLILDDGKFKLINQVNKGPGGARNTGLKIAQGDYIGFLDSDDYFDSSFLSKMYNKVIKDSADIVICDTKKVNSCQVLIKEYKHVYKNPITNIEAFKDIMCSKNITSISPNKLFKRELFKNVFYPENIIVNEDSATIYKLILKAKKITFVNESLFYYVQHSESSMNSFSRKKLDDRINIANMIKKDLEKRNLILKYYKEYKIYYLLNVVLSGSLQIVKQSSTWEKELTIYLRKCNFKLKDIFLLRKIHLKKMIGLLMLKLNKKLFFLISQKIGS